MTLPKSLGAAFVVVGLTMIGTGSSLYFGALHDARLARDQITGMTTAGSASSADTSTSRKVIPALNAIDQKLEDDSQDIRFAWSVLSGGFFLTIVGLVLWFRGKEAQDRLNTARADYLEVKAEVLRTRYSIRADGHRHDTLSVDDQQQPSRSTTDRTPDVQAAADRRNDALFQLNVAEYQAHMGRNTNWIALQFSLYPVTFLVVGALAAMWSSFPAARGVLPWGGSAVLLSILLIGYQTTIEQYTGTLYLETELRRRMNTLLSEMPHDTRLTVDYWGFERWYAARRNLTYATIEFGPVAFATVAGGATLAVAVHMLRISSWSLVQDIGAVFDVVLLVYVGVKATMVYRMRRDWSESFCTDGSGKKLVVGKPACAGHAGSVKETCSAVGDVRRAEPGVED